jgi:hypothetical protein
MNRFLIAVTLAGAVGFLTTLAASVLPYALLFQAQPYRVLWILKVLQAPLGFLLIAHWTQSARLIERLAALALVGFFCVVHHNVQEALIIGLALPLSFVVSLASEQTKQPGWWWYAVARGFVLGAIGWTLYRWWFFFHQRDVVRQHLDLDELVMLDLFNPIFCLVVFVRFLPSSKREAEDEGVATGFPSIRWCAVCAAILIPTAIFATQASATLRQEHSRLGSDIAFVKDFVRHQSHAKPPQIYSSLGRPDLLWIDVHATSYFDILQTAGVMFNRATADEIERRIGLVNKVEMARQRKEEVFLDDARKLGMENLFKLSFNFPDPARGDLVKLCQEPGLDYVVIPQEFPGLYSATNGRIYVYECYKVREITRLPFSARAEMSATSPPALSRER